MAENKYIIGVVCSKGHPNYYDKRVICPGKIHHRTTQEDGVVLDQILVECQECGEEMTIKVDCEGYK